MYIPVCPATETSAEYLLRQRENFLRGIPAPDFPGGKGESEHLGRPTASYVQKVAGVDALRAFGMEKWNDEDPSLTEGQCKVLRKANEILGFA